MAEIDRDRIERLKSRAPVADRKRTASLETVAKRLRAQSRSLTAQPRELDRTVAGEEYREAYKGALRRKG